jgi:hypothetical protein
LEYLEVEAMAALVAQGQAVLAAVAVARLVTLVTEVTVRLLAQQQVQAVEEALGVVHPTAVAINTV